MKTWMRAQTSYGKRNIALTAYIRQSKRHGIPSSVQKTWKIYCDLATLDDETRARLKMQAERWRAEWMARWFPSGPPAEVMTQEEIV